MLIYIYLPNNVHKNIYLIVGDADYGLEPWLMTPITDAPEGSAEAKYTQCHTSTRNCVERTFGLLKNVWRCLLSHRVLHYEPVMASNIIIACAVLHNIRLSYNLMGEEFDIDEEGEAAAVQRAALQENVEARNRVRAQAQEIVDADEEQLNVGNRLLEAKRVQKGILRTQFGLRNET